MSLLHSHEALYPAMMPIGRPPLHFQSTELTAQQQQQQQQQQQHRHYDFRGSGIVGCETYEGLPPYHHPRLTQDDHHAAYAAGHHQHQQQQEHQQHQLHQQQQQQQQQRHQQPPLRNAAYGGYPPTLPIPHSPNYGGNGGGGGVGGPFYPHPVRQHPHQMPSHHFVGQPHHYDSTYNGRLVGGEGGGGGGGGVGVGSLSYGHRSRYLPYPPPSHPSHHHQHHYYQHQHQHPQQNTGMFTPAGQQLVPSSVLHYLPQGHNTVASLSPSQGHQQRPSYLSSFQQPSFNMRAHHQQQQQQQDSETFSRPLRSETPLHPLHSMYHMTATAGDDCLPDMPPTMSISTPTPTPTPTIYSQQPAAVTPSTFPTHSMTESERLEIGVKLQPKDAGDVDGFPSSNDSNHVISPRGRVVGEITMINSTQLGLAETNTVFTSNAAITTSVAVPTVATTTSECLITPPLISATGTDSGISSCSMRARSDDSTQSTPVYANEYPMSAGSSSGVSYHYADVKEMDVNLIVAVDNDAARDKDRDRDRAIADDEDENVGEECIFPSMEERSASNIEADEEVEECTTKNSAFSSTEIRVKEKQSTQRSPSPERDDESEATTTSRPKTPMVPQDNVITSDNRRRRSHSHSSASSSPVPPGMDEQETLAQQNVPIMGSTVTAAVAVAVAVAVKKKRKKRKRPLLCSAIDDNIMDTQCADKIIEGGHLEEQLPGTTNFEGQHIICTTNQLLSSSSPTPMVATATTTTATATSFKTISSPGTKGRADSPASATDGCTVRPLSRSWCSSPWSPFPTASSSDWLPQYSPKYRVAVGKSSSMAVPVPPHNSPVDYAPAMGNGGRDNTREVPTNKSESIYQGTTPPMATAKTKTVTAKSMSATSSAAAMRRNRIVERDLIPSKKPKKRKSVSQTLNDTTATTTTAAAGNCSVSNNIKCASSNNKQRADADSETEMEEREVCRERKDIIPLPGFQQTFGSTEIGRFSENFLLALERHQKLGSTDGSTNDNMVYDDNDGMVFGGGGSAYYSRERAGHHLNQSITPPPWATGPMQNYEMTAQNQHHHNYHHPHLPSQHHHPHHHHHHHHHPQMSTFEHHQRLNMPPYRGIGQMPARYRTSIEDPHSHSQSQQEAMLMMMRRRANAAYMDDYHYWSRGGSAAYYGRGGMSSRFSSPVGGYGAFNEIPCNGY